MVQKDGLVTEVDGKLASDEQDDGGPVFIGRPVGSGLTGRVDTPLDLDILRRREDSRNWYVRLLGCHILIAGVTGAGKGSVLQSLLRALGPYVHTGLVRLFGIDPKGGMELGAAGGKVLYHRLVTDEPQEWAELLEQLVADMKARAKRLAGVTRLHTPTVDDPLVVLVIDELASLTSYRPRSREARDLFARIESSLALLLSQGRAVGFVVVCALQDPRKEVLPNRDLFPARIALRLVEAEATNMVLRPNARELGADCTLIPVDQPGGAWVWCDGEQEPTRVRAGYPTDDDIATHANTTGPSTTAPSRPVSSMCPRPTSPRGCRRDSFSP